MIVNRPQWQPAYNASKAAVHQLTRSLAEFGYHAPQADDLIRRLRLPEEWSRWRR
jgi:NAD(P)-dependent dehydrogenase (short-subunit alcohol dehydrogenase family)